MVGTDAAALRADAVPAAGVADPSPVRLLASPQPQRPARMSGRPPRRALHGKQPLMYSGILSLSCPPSWSAHFSVPEFSPTALAHPDMSAH